MDDKDKGEGEEIESENLRDLILQQFVNLDPSETSDDDSYKVRLSCILEDDESESSAPAQRDFPKEVEKASKTNQESEKGPPETLQSVFSESLYDSESDEFAGENIQITDLDDVTLRETEKTDVSDRETSDDWEKTGGFAIKKLKSSDNVHRRPVVIRRRELSSDSSDLDISATNSAEAPSSELKIVEINEGDDENTLNMAQDNIYVESETSADEDLEQKVDEGVRGVELEVVDNETLAPIFAKVSRTYLEKTKANVKWEENEKIDRVFRELVKEEAQKRGDHLSIQDVHIRGTSRNESNPPIPPETYLWEELKRLRERGGYPWTYLDKPPFDEATWKKYMEHVYEPINPPPRSPERSPETPPETSEVQKCLGSSIPESETQLARIPSKASLSKKDSMKESKVSEEVSTEGTQELQERLESHFLTPTTLATSETTVSQPKMDITCTGLDTSEFEHLPAAKQGSLVRTRREQMRAQAAEIQQRLRNHAGRIRNKFNNMPRPNLGKKDRLKTETPGEKARFKLPEMHTPKITFPDRTKFKLPEKAKLHLPESSRFHLPDRSKFHLPERPKLKNIAERAKIHLPEKGKFHLDKSKFHLPEKAKFHLPEKARFHLPDKSKFHLPEKAKFKMPNRPKLELPSFKKSTGPAQVSQKSRFDFDLKSYPKLFTKHSKEYMTSSPKQTRGRTPPPRMQRANIQEPKTWNLKLDDEMKYVDDDFEGAGMRETDSRKSESLFEKDVGYMEDLEKVPTLSTKSSTSRLSEMSDDRKKGVLEEINADEFFLRQKGISQDDIDMGQYLSREIREAFRSPDINALAKMDYMDEENTDPRMYHREPKRPKRGSFKKKSILKKASTSDPSISEDGYKTYPPRRPGRKSRSQSKSLLNEEAVIAETSSRYENPDVNISRYDNEDVNLSRYDNVEYDEDEPSEHYKSPGPAREYQHYKVPRSHAPVCPSPPVKRKASLEDEGSHKRIHEAWDEEEPPKPMARRKKDKKKKREEAEEQMERQKQAEDQSRFLPEELEITSDEQIPQKVIEESEEVVLESQVDSPVPPKRTRSSGSRSLRSFATESDINRSFHSEPERDRPDQLEEEIISEEGRIPEESPDFQFSPPKPHVYEVTDLDDPGFGYATVGKPTVTKPERHRKPERPPPPRRKKEISVPVYNTYPRRAPVRPLRNYSTLGPSRPPRLKKVSPIEKTLAERQSRAYAEIKNRFDEFIDPTEVSGSSKDLQTEKVIEKMKGRPLPPPPRPPRQKSKGPEEELEPTEEEKLSLSILRDEEFPLERKVTAFVHESPFEKEAVEESTTSTQTDPLPEDFSFGTEDNSDVIPEFSHEQLRIQQAFLEEMKKEEEELRQRSGDENDLVDAELKAEVIRQIEDIIAEEKRIMERKNEKRKRKEESEQGTQKKDETKSYLDVEADMGYASLERRNHRPEPTARVPQELPTKLDKLQVKELEVESLNVHEVQSDQIFVKELQGNRIASPDIDNRGGTMALGCIDLPPSFIDQVVAKIPWDSLRQTRELISQDTLPTPPVRPQRRRRGSQIQDDSDDDALFQPRRSHRRSHKPQHSTDDDERRQQRLESSSSSNIPELSLQLARACTSAGVEALRSFARANAAVVQSFDRELCVQTVLCIAIALIAGFFLFGFDAKIVHMHRWDFQFPPQPPNAGF